MTRVKICGLREREHAAAAVDAGADLLGFIFYPPVRRYVDPDSARAIADAVRGRAELVGVFVNQPLEGIVEVAERVGLDMVQLSGDEPPELTARVPRPVLRTVHVGPATTIEEVAERSAGARLIHLDTRRDGQFGGTGSCFDWGFAAEAGALGPVLLAGGLDPECVPEAIRAARPWGVDVSSGIETEGRKDLNKIRAFLAAAKAVR